MRSLTMYCGARDQEVRVIVTDGPTHDGHAELLDADIVCLEIGQKCTGGMCPVCAQPVQAVAANIVRQGLQNEITHTFARPCAACDRTTDHMLVGGGYFICTVCSTSHYVRQNAQGPAHVS